MRKAIQQTIPRCKAELPVVPLGAGEIEPAAPASADHAAHLEKLWEFMAALADTPLDTRELQPFEGADHKWQKLIDDKERAEEERQAALVYSIVVLKLLALLLGIFCRNNMLPGFLSFCLLNIHSGWWDEVAIVGLVVYLMGPKKVWNSVLIFEQQQLTPFLASPNRLGPDLMADGLVGLPQQILQKYNVIGQRAKQD